MVNQDILGGLRNAVSHGESLQSAMQSFYNAGYKKEDIYEAAKIVQAGGVSSEMPIQSQTQLIPTQMKQQSPATPQVPSQQPSQQPSQIASKYEQPKSSGGFMQSKGFVVLLAGILLLLIGGLVTVVVFKEKILGMFGLSLPLW